jgi:hypothetical protein
VAKEGARTVPPREHGGNCDIKNLSQGSRVYFPVYVRGGNLSMGDIHWSQGDGESSFCGAIEMSGHLDLHVDLIKGGVRKYGMVNPIFKPGPVEPCCSEYPVFEGISVDEPAFTVRGKAFGTPACHSNDSCVRPPAPQRGPAMPTYEFLCATCGLFEQRRSLHEAGDPMLCPTCEVVS